jgi:hypothetical protein
VSTLQSVITAVESNVDGLIANGVIIEHMSTQGSDDTVNALRVLREARCSVLAVPARLAATN